MKLNRKSFSVLASLVLVAVVAGVWWYQPWHLWQGRQLEEQLLSVDAQQREAAIERLSTWRSAQRIELLRRYQAKLLPIYETAINESLAQKQWRAAQVWLQDLQRLYPHLPQVVAAQQRVSLYFAQQINLQVTQLNAVLADNRSLTEKTLTALTTLLDQLADLAPEHALVHDRRILYALLRSLDDALARADFTTAQPLFTWGTARFPAEPGLIDRQLQLHFQLAGRPTQVLATCVADGAQCWHITDSPPLFSQPWIVQSGMSQSSVAEWPILSLVRTELGSYYRHRALEAYAQDQFMQASIDLMRAAYFTSPAELDDYWEWLVYAFHEREQQEAQQAELAQQAGFYHTLLTQIAAADLEGAQETILTLQTLDVAPWFVDQIAFPMLGEAYLKLARQLAHDAQYELAVRLLIAGEEFIPAYSPVKPLLADYQRQLDADAPQLEPALHAAVDSIAEETLPTVKTPLCTQATLEDSIYMCHDLITPLYPAPTLVVLPDVANRLAWTGAGSARAGSATARWAIAQYPLTIADYNFYCMSSGECQPRQRLLEPLSDRRSQQQAVMTGQMDLSDVQQVIQDYDSFCRTSGGCDLAEPHAQALAIQDLSIEEVLGYIRWLSAMTGAQYRLPTVDEWRYAILADEMYRCSYDTLLNIAQQKVVPVQQGMRNRWGVTYQLSHVGEWVQIPEGIAIAGPEEPETAPICSLPIMPYAAERAPQASIRLLREW